MSVMTVTTRITRRYLERKTKSDLAQMYLDLLDWQDDLIAASKSVLAKGCMCHDTADPEWHSKTCPIPAIKEAIGNIQEVEEAVQQPQGETKP